MARIYVSDKVTHGALDLELLATLAELSQENNVLVWQRETKELLYLLLRRDSIHIIFATSFKAPLQFAPVSGDWRLSDGTRISNAYAKWGSISSELTAWLKENVTQILGEEDLKTRKATDFETFVKVFPLYVIRDRINPADIQPPRWGYVCRSWSDFTTYLSSPRLRWQHDQPDATLKLTQVEVGRIVRLLGLAAVDFEHLRKGAPVSEGIRLIPDNYEFTAAVTGERFFGRKRELESLVNRITSGKHVAVLGLQRVGKTSLVREAIRRVSARAENPVVFVTINLNQIPLQRKLYAEFVRDFLFALVEGLNQAIGASPRLDEIERGIDAFVKKFRRPIEVARGLNQILRELVAALDRRSLVIFLDEVQVLGSADESAGSSQPTFDQFVRLLGELAKESVVRFVFGGRYKVLEYNDKFDWQLLKLCAKIELSLMDQTSASDLMKEPTKGYLEWDPRAIRYLYEVTGGHPYFIQYLCSKMVQELNGRHLTHAMLEDAEKVVESFVEDERERIKLLYVDFESDSRLVARIFRGMPTAAGQWRTHSQIMAYLAQFGNKSWTSDYVHQTLIGLTAAGILNRKNDPDTASYQLAIGLLQRVFPPDAGVKPMETPVHQIEQAVCRQLEAGEECDLVEFKGSVRLDIAKHFLGPGALEVSEGVTQDFLKTVVGFLNSSGGAVVLGVLERERFLRALQKRPEFFKQHGKVLLLGIDVELPTKDEWDGYERMIRDLVARHIGRDSATLLQIKKLEQDGKTLAVVYVERSAQWCWLDNKIFCVRSGAQTLELAGRDEENYKKRFLDRN